MVGVFAIVKSTDISHPQLSRRPGDQLAGVGGKETNDESILQITRRCSGSCAVSRLHMDAGSFSVGVVAVKAADIVRTYDEMVAEGRGLVSNVHGDNNVTIFPGTLRDYFAGQVLGTLLQGMFSETNENIADQAYQLADAMLKAREES